MAYRYNLEQVLEINRQAFALPLSTIKEQEIVNTLVDSLYKNMYELFPLEGLGLAIYSDDKRRLNMAFSIQELEEEAKEEITQCYQSQR